MNRTGLLIALAVAATVGLVFGLRPDLDLKLAALFFDPERGGFWRAYDPVYLRARDVAVWLVTLVAAPAVVALAAKFVWPRRPLIIRRRSHLRQRRPGYGSQPVRPGSSRSRIRVRPR